LFIFVETLKPNIMTYKNYKIELNKNYHVAHKETKFIFWNTEESEETIGFAATIEECVELINERLD
jgi:hypothetical protein